MTHKIVILLIALLITACATTKLIPGAESVKVVTDSQKENLCESLGIFNEMNRAGYNKSASAMNQALNEVARRGGNGIYIIDSDLARDGASVTAEAMKCEFK